MAIKCNNCGGDMHFHIPTQKLQCIHCDDVLDIEELKINHRAEEMEDFNDDETVETALYQCPECGAEVRSFEEETTIFCAYCGKQAFLKQKENSTKPKYIVPFRIDKKEIKEKYNKHLSKMKFVPKELKDASALSEFRGIYIPHWSSNYVADGILDFEGEEHYRRGDYVYTDTYAISAEVDGSIDDITFDASLAFDDTLASAIAPFSTNEQKEFHEGYLAGFYADKETIEQNAYDDASKEIAEETIINELHKTRVKTSRSITAKYNPEQLRKTDTNLLMLPVWFLTHRNKDRVSYAVMNGQTGKMIMDVPVNKKSFFVFAGILATILSAIFVFLFSFIIPSVTASAISFASIIMLLISSFILKKELEMIYKRDHYMEQTAQVTSPRIKIISILNWMFEHRTKASFCIFGAIMAWCAFFMVFPQLSMNINTGTGPNIILVGASLLMLIVQIIFSLKTSNLAIHKEKIVALLTIIPMVLAIPLYILAPAYELYYYMLTILSVAGIIGNCLACIHGFDYLTSRPVPNFFEREGANR